MGTDSGSSSGAYRPARSAPPLRPLPSSLAPSPAFAPSHGPADADWIEGTGVHPAPATLEPSAPARPSTADRPSRMTPAAAGLPMPPAAATPRPGPHLDADNSAPGSPSRPPAPHTQSLPIPPSSTPLVLPAADQETGEELLLLHVIRLMRRVLGPGALTPVDRAFVCGAKATFDHLSSECDRILARELAELAQSPVSPPETVSSSRDASKTKPAAKPRAPRKRTKTPKTPKAGGSPGG